MSEWTIDNMVEGLRSFGGTDARERFYEACASELERQRKIERAANAVVDEWVPWKGDKLPSTFGVSVGNLVQLAEALTVDEKGQATDG